MATYVTKTHLENFTEKLLNNDKKIRDELKQEISNLPSGGGSGSSYTLPTASTTTLGGVKVDGTTVTINPDGVISATASGSGSYTLPKATDTTLGGVKVDNDTITVDSEGVISSKQYTLPTASNSTLGGVKVDGTTITVGSGGVISSKQYTLPTASDTTLGGVKIDNDTITVNGEGVISATKELPIGGTTGQMLVKKSGTNYDVEWKDAPQGGAAVGVATTDKAGIVKPDGTSVTVDVDGTIHATTDANQIKQNVEDYMTKNPVSATVGDKTVTEEKLSDDVLAAIKSKKILFADTVADINNLTLSETENQIVRTLGFYNKLDGGGALYNVYKSNNSKNLILFKNYSNKKDDAEVKTTVDGYVVLNGDFSSKPTFEFNPFAQKPNLKANTSYTCSYEYISGDFTGDSGAVMFANIYTTFTDKKYFSVKNLLSDYTNKKKITITSTSDGTFKTMKFTFSGNGNIAFNNLVIRFQIEEGSEVTEWHNGTYATDGHTCIALDNDYQAELIVLNDSINIKQLGYLPNNKTIDCHDSISNYIRLCERDAEKYELYFPVGKWYFSETDIQNDRKGVKLRGTSAQVATDERIGETAIMPFSNNQEYIWNIGKRVGSKDIVGGNEIKNFTFSTGWGEKTFCKIGLLLTYCCYSSFDGLYFHYFNGTGLRIDTGWENDWGFLNFRGVGYMAKDRTYNAMEFVNTAGVPSAISANIFDYINFEGISGNCMWAAQGCNFCHSEIRNIQLEWTHCESKADDVGVQYNADTKEWDDKSDEIEHIYLLKGNCGTGNTPIIIETITISGGTRNCYTISYTDDEGIEHKRYKVRSALFGENEGYVSTNTHGIAVVVGKIRASRSDLPLYHTAYEPKSGTSIQVLTANKDVRPPQCNEYLPGSLNIYDVDKKFKTTDGYNVISPKDVIVPNTSSILMGYVENTYSNDCSALKHGTMYMNLDGSKKIKLRLYMNKETADQVDSTVTPISNIIGNDGVKRTVRLVELKRSDFISGKYPLKEWFDYEVSPSSLPLGSMTAQISIHRNNGLLLDYVGVSNENKIIGGQSLINNNTNIKYSPAGATIWCHDRREAEDSANGVMCVYNGTSWMTLTGKAVADLLLAKYTITYNLTNCTGTNSNTTILLNTSYNNTISASSGYSLTDDDIVCTMGGNPITVTNGKIGIKNVTGDIVITATAKQIFNVTNNLTNCVSSNTDTTVIEGSTYNATITAESGYTLNSVTCTMGGVDQTVNDGVISIASVTGDIVITANAI